VVGSAFAALGLARLLPADGAWVYPRLATALAVALLPGWLIADALGRRGGAPTLLWTLAPLAGALGLVSVVGLPLSIAAAVLAAVGAIALVVSSRRGKRRLPPVGGSAIVVGAGAVFGIALWHVAGHVGGDGLFHLARVRKLVALDELSLEAVGEFADGGLHPGYALPLWHGFLALIAWLSGVDPELAVLHAPSVLAPLAFLVTFEAARALFGSIWLAFGALAAQVALISLAAGHGGAYVNLANPGTASRQLIIPATLALVFAYVREPERVLLAGIAAGSLALTLVHPTDAPFLAVPLGGFLVVRSLVEWGDFRRLAAAFAAFAIPAAATLAALYPVARRTASLAPDPEELSRALTLYASHLDVFADGDYRLAPEVVSRGGAVAVAALALVPLAGLAGRARWASLVLGGTLAVLLLMLVPELFTRLSDLFSLSQSRRAAGFIPFAFALVGGAAVLTRLVSVLVLPIALAAGIAIEAAYPGDFTLRLEEGGGPGVVTWIAALGAAGAIAVATIWRPSLERRGVVAGAALLLFVVPIALDSARDWRPSENRRPGPLTPGLIDAVRARVPEGDVVFSDLETSYRIAAAAPVYVASAPPAHVADTKDNRPYERRRDTIRFFGTGDLAIPRRYGAHWLVVDRRRFADVDIGGSPVYRDRRFELYRL
jgi:hypothetical protein